MAAGTGGLRRRFDGIANTSDFVGGEIVHEVVRGGHDDGGRRQLLAGLDVAPIGRTCALPRISIGGEPSAIANLDLNAASPLPAFDELKGRITLLGDRD
jgi:hypothetical protein